MQTRLFHLSLVLLCAALGFALSPAPASAEPYEEYLQRLRYICEVECLQPRQFQRAARKRDGDDTADMALIMDVAEVERNGDLYELYSTQAAANPLVEQEILGSAGINTSSRNGIGGLPRGGGRARHPETIIVAFDAQTFFDLLNASDARFDQPVRVLAQDGIIVEGDRTRERVEPSLAALRSYFRNRRIVVRGTPDLQPALIGARLDYRRKQVTLRVDSADEIVLLPRFDANGEPVLDQPD